MNKKIILILFSMVIILSFIGCGNLEQMNKAEKSNTNEQAIEDPRKESLKYKSAQYYSYDDTAMIQLTDINNENIQEEYKKPFKVTQFETNTSGITRFILEDGTIRIVHCNFIVLDKK